jgi:hypothetical protein
MGGDDGAADGKPHAHAAGFRREKFFEQAVHDFRCDPWSGILDGDQRGAGPVALGPYA